LKKRRSVATGVLFLDKKNGQKYILVRTLKYEVNLNLLNLCFFLFQKSMKTSWAVRKAQSYTNHRKSTG